MTSIALVEFTDDVQKIRRLLELIQAFRDFGASKVPGLLSSKPSEWEEALSLHAEATVVRTDLPLMAGAILLYAVGRFEYLVRECVEGVVDGLSAKASSFQELPANLQKTWREQVLMVAQAPRRYNFDEIRVDAILAELVACRQGGSPVALTTGVVSITESNMRPEIVSDLLKRVGISDFWRTVGKQLHVQIFVGESEESACSKAVQARLTDIMNLRNQIAHPKGDTSFPSPEDVASELDFLEALARVLDEVCAMAISDFKP